MKNASGKRTYGRGKEHYAEILIACETGSKTCDEIIEATGLTIGQVRYAIATNNLKKYYEIFDGQSRGVSKNYDKIMNAINGGGCVTAKEISSRTSISVASIRTALKRYNEEAYKKVFSGKSYKAKRNYDLIVSAIEYGYTTPMEIKAFTGLKIEQIRYANKIHGDGTIQL